MDCKAEKKAIDSKVEALRQQLELLALERSDLVTSERAPGPRRGGDMWGRFWGLVRTE